ncbi:hypothetical protein EV356DRAFT_11124 [Viridothelium virens]|uniref:Rhodopsin domain-containing protein n=1 Tax=Viridothelium virens TaxID=1048519 RepID=A0A6A6HQ30_VIRVR|nr:hypothetical protein EV356DRAFT_11124 [Viridothelium virens]
MSYLALDFNQSIPQALQHIPALPPPDGVTPNFVDPPTRSTLLVTVISVLFGLMFIFYLSRVYMKLMIIGEMTLDDLTCTIGLVGAIAYYTGVVVGATRGPIGKHQWDVPRSEEMNMNSIFPLWIRVVVTGPTYLLFKATLFIMYLKIFKPMRWVRVSVYIGLVLLCLFYVPVMVVQFYFATPRPHETWTAHFMSPMQQKTGILLISLPTVGLAFDVYLLLLPMAAISQVQLPPKRKLGVMMIFLSGIL